jgi:hypothetical protein
VIAKAILRRLAERNVKLYLEGDRLRFRAPAGALTDDLRANITDHRTEIISLLRPRPVLAAGERCVTCDRRGWVDEPPVAGRIRTHCGSCGRFIGYRPTDHA